MIEIVDAKTIANIFEMSDRSVRRFASKGIFIKHQNGQYDIAGCVKGYIQYIKKQTEIEIRRKLKKEQNL
ncbi:hypothetical protein Ccar_25920 (plasmid) [Clostridium carboxidivorans P7]|uniref:DNA-binding protein n=1 Tax=Clostridium carboxidivorans P7 TaxID=536227 RepID=C6PZY0_9CLOT|nr:hypothetical protein [Clostridium carboxidivorans]ADO12132.1 hypothetical protein Ccar_4292 [Clostridium carboxidivorans P7]AKN34267.1 hypothetical protein Ccar_25920 [Clostridium carboxidivorans P7]EET85190.1 hypothetical protein CcarbDRAFT_4347 [Clostridium carboxidivorans P7]EFG87534.1 hypothetical protein CLCAR_3069 [Clostridium carboxidivorans P7]